jgi:predicted transcriptional regulator
MNNTTHTVADYMARNLITVKPDEDIHAAAKVLLERHISGAPVVDQNGRPVGILSIKDCFKIIYSASYHQDWGGCVADYMTRDVQTVDAAADIMTVGEMFLHSPYRRFPVMSNGRLVGQISRHDVLSALESLW